MLDSDSSGADEDWGENDHDVNSDRSSDSSDSETVETDRPRSRSRSTSVVTIPTPRSTSANARSSDSEDELVPSTSNGKRKGNRSRSRPMGKAAAKKPRQAQSSTIEVAPDVARDEEVSGWVNADPLQATQRSFHFRGNCGSKLNNLDGTSEALEFFFALLDEEVQDDLIKEINAYAEVQIQKNTPLTKHSRYRDWKPIDRYQLYKFLAMLIAMGMDPRPYISDFWSTNGRLYTPWYGAMFPRRKFQIVYHSMLHVCEPDANSKSKIEPF
ncbi:hypothetical protein RRG08_005589 [Elysia crispata]|uniref:PiggyBac transposable element-derived protein domain-containing protein n=1 Tax=Elysia crispata TaxID=231223 RepID=A0AAE0YXA0_9GAST|nr:hypothetical protein RRG08_005589 [Elysia crispata]